MLLRLSQIYEFADFFLTVDRHPGTVQHTLLVFCFVGVHTTTPPAPVDEYINAICHVLHYAQSPQTFTYHP